MDKVCHIFKIAGNKYYFTISIVVGLSFLFAWFCSPYSQAIAQNLLVLSTTAFSLFIVAYIFLDGKFTKDIDLLTELVDKIDRNEELCKFMETMIPSYKQEYKANFLFILTAECLLLISIFSEIVTVFIRNYHWVEALGLGLIIAAMVLLTLWLLINYCRLSLISLFKNIEGQLESAKESHTRGKNHNSLQ